MVLVTVYEWSDEPAADHGPAAGCVDLAAAARYDDLWDEAGGCSRATGLPDWRQTVYLTAELGPVQHCWSVEPGEDTYVTMDRWDAFRWLVSQGYGEVARSVFVEWAAYEDAEVVALRVLRAVQTEPRHPSPDPSETAPVKIHHLLYGLIGERGLSSVENVVEALARYALMGFRAQGQDGNDRAAETFLAEEEFAHLVRRNFEHLD